MNKYLTVSGLVHFVVSLFFTIVLACLAAMAWADNDVGTAIYGAIAALITLLATCSILVIDANWVGWKEGFDRCDKINSMFKG